MFDPDRQAHKRIIDPCLAACTLVHRCMRHRRWVSDETFNSAERFREREAGERIDEGLDAASAAFELETEHRAKSILLTPRDFVSGVICEARIINATYGRMIDDCLNYCRCVSTMHIHARVQRSQPAEGEKAVEWSARNAETVRPPGKLFTQRRICGHHRSADDIAVSVQVFRSRVNDQVGTELDRSLQHWRQESVVDRYGRTSIMASTDHRFEVCNS